MVQNKTNRPDIEIRYHKEPGERNKNTKWLQLIQNTKKFTKRRET